MTTTLPPTASAHDTAPVAPQALARGTVVGRYLVLEHLGQGGMGTVYKAYDPDLDRSIALKLVRSDARNPDQRQRLRGRLLREAQALARLSDPNVVSVHDVGTFGDDVFVAMELVDGTTLTRVLTDEAPAVPRIVELFVGAGRGIAAAHEVSIVHRDFKPDNVIVGHDGGVRVLDFGLAAIVEDGDDNDDREPGAGTAPLVTAAGTVVGTPAYMSPEQLRGGPLDERADQFSFCVALYEALYGERPIADPALVPSHTPTGVRIPRRIRAALRRGLAGDPAVRHASMRALLGELAFRAVHLKAWLAGAGVLAVVGIGAFVVGAMREPEAAVPCEGAEARLAGVWDAGRKAAVRAALVRHGNDVAPATVERLLDRYTAAWLAMHTASCRATHVLGEQSTELLDLRTECLDRRLAEVRYLTDVLIAGEGTIASRAVASVHALAPIEDCANTTALRDPIPPRDPVVARALRDRFARVRVAFSVGKYDDVIREGRTLADAAEVAGDHWTQANATYLIARATRSRGAATAAEEQLYRAIAIAETGRASDVVVDAWMTLAWIAGEDLGRYEDGLRLANVARGVLARLGGNPRLEASLEDHVGVLHLDRGALVEARRHLERGLALREKLFGDQDSDYAASLQHVAILEQASGDHAKALDLHRRARRISEAELGPRHPEVLVMIGAEGATLHELGRHREALDVLVPALAIVEQVAGGQSEMTASFLTNIGLARWKLNQLAEARAAFDRSFAIVERVAPNGLRAATLHLDLALLLLDTDDLDRARTHAARAVAGLEKLVGAAHPDLAMALETQATAELRSSRAAPAIAALERALAIRTAIPGTHPNDLAATRFDLAKAIVASRGDSARARSLAETARSELERAGDADGVREVTAWLATHARP